MDEEGRRRVDTERHDPRGRPDDNVDPGRAVVLARAVVIGRLRVRFVRFDVTVRFGISLADLKGVLDWDKAGRIEFGPPHVVPRCVAVVARVGLSFALRPPTRIALKWNGLRACSCDRW